MYEAQLELMRCIEVYSAATAIQVDVSLLMFEESSEYYQYMSIVDEEKIAFKKLIDIKDKLYVELRDYKMEAQ
jgi:hypothetical protein